MIIGALAAPGCLPYAVPPARLSVGSAARSGVVATSAGRPLRPSFVLVRVGMHPLDVLDGELPVDVGVGYEAEHASSSEIPTVEGGYLEVGAYPFKAALAPNLMLRAGAYGALSGLTRSGTPGMGVGGELGGVLELTGKVSGAGTSVDGDGTVAAGFANGRWAVGLFGTGAVRDFTDGAYRSAAAGFSVRMPFLAGIVCCAVPHGSESHAPRRTPATPRHAQ